jgi:hypothetical protein
MSRGHDPGRTEYVLLLVIEEDVRAKGLQNRPLVVQADEVSLGYGDSAFN